jgi:DNA-binding GntR family transcriptional regulator
MKASSVASRTPKNGITVREKTYAYLNGKILSGNFVQGERLTEESLAAELGVSRTPVREALHKLEREGFVKPLETRGFFVPRDSREEVEELFGLRGVLEGYSLGLICRDIPEKASVLLEGFIQKAEGSFKKKKLDEVFKWNTQFHDTLHGLVAHRARLHTLMVDMRKYVLRYRKETLQAMSGAKRAIDGHRKIMLALRLKDPDLCERVMREHIREAKEDALQVLRTEDIPKAAVRRRGKKE